MHRDHVLELLESYRDRQPNQKTVADRILALVRGHTDCFERTCRPGHVTASAWVLSADRSRCLLVHHAKLGRWLQPGGHCDGDPNPAEVALREVSEETGLTDLRVEDALPLDLDVHLIPARRDREGREIEDAHEHHDIRFLISSGGGEPLVCSDESHDVRWFTAREAREVTDEDSVLRMLRKAGPHD